MRVKVYADTGGRAGYPFLGPGWQRSAQPPHYSRPWAFSGAAGKTTGRICEIPGRRKPTAENRLDHDLTLSNLFLLLFPNSGSHARPSSSSSFRIIFSTLGPVSTTRYLPRDQNDNPKRVSSYSDQEKGERWAERDECASEKHSSPHDWAAGGGREPRPREAKGSSAPGESPRGAATQPHEGRGAMSPPDPGEGEGGAPKPRTKVRPTSSTEAEEGTTPGRCPMATSHLIPTSGRPMNT